MVRILIERECLMSVLRGREDKKSGKGEREWCEMGWGGVFGEGWVGYGFCGFDFCVGGGVVNRDENRGWVVEIEGRRGKNGGDKGYV